MRDARLIRERTHGQGMARLEAVVALLRGEDGCPWDRKQTLESLKPYLIEEAYELLDAIDADDLALHREELGDVLLQVVLQTQIRRERLLFVSDFSETGKFSSQFWAHRPAHCANFLCSTSFLSHVWGNICPSPSPA